MVFCSLTQPDDFDDIRGIPLNLAHGDDDDPPNPNKDASNQQHDLDTHKTASISPEIISSDDDMRNQFDNGKLYDFEPSTITFPWE